MTEREFMDSLVSDFNTISALRITKGMADCYSEDLFQKLKDIGSRLQFISLDRKFLEPSLYPPFLYDYIALGRQFNRHSRAMAYTRLIRLTSAEHPDMAMKHAHAILELSLPYNHPSVQGAIDFLAHKASEGLPDDDHEWYGCNELSGTSASLASDREKRKILGTYYPNLIRKLG